MPLEYEPGSLIGAKYRVERIIGDGGMGVVVAARHLDLGEHVAIKLLRKEAMANEATLARFRREGRAAAKIRSKHVARVYDVDALPNGTPYIVMELLEGHDLAVELGRQGKLALSVLMPLFLQACEAVALAHAAGIVHRDLKPSNLFLSRSDGDEPILKVLDFGISKIVETSDENEEALHVTTAFETLGSPVYMSPEQMRSSRDVDARADIWSLGVILFRLLTGEIPFPGTTVTDVCARILVDVAPSARALCPDIPEVIDRVITRCLAKDPRDRFQTVGELALALEPVVAAKDRTRLERVVRASSTPVLVAGPDGVQTADHAVIGGEAAVARDAPTVTGDAPSSMHGTRGEEVTQIHDESVDGAAGASSPRRLDEPVAKREAPPRGSRWPLGIAVAAAIGGAVLWLGAGAEKAPEAPREQRPAGRSAAAPVPESVQPVSPPELPPAEAPPTPKPAANAPPPEVEESPAPRAARSSARKAAPLRAMRPPVEAPAAAPAPAAPAPPPAAPRAGDDHPLHL